MLFRFAIIAAVFLAAVVIFLLHGLPLVEVL
jgi:hypothetical protein